MGRKGLLAVCGVVLVAALSACGGGSSGGQNQGGQTSATKGDSEKGAATGEALYKGNCLACHGGNLEGKIGPNLQTVGGHLSRNQIVARIQNGGGGMPEFKVTLQDQDIQTMADWLAAKK